MRLSRNQANINKSLPFTLKITRKMIRKGNKGNNLSIGSKCIGARILKKWIKKNKITVTSYVWKNYGGYIYFEGSNGHTQICLTTKEKISIMDVKEPQKITLIKL